MQENNGSFAKPGHLAEYLAELDNQLRLSHACPTIRRKTATVPGWSAARTRMAAGLVALVGEETGQEGLQRLGTVVPALLDRLESRTDRLAQLAGPLVGLESLLVDILSQLDAGTSVGDLLEDPRWESVLADFHTAGTPLSVLSEMDGCLNRWQDRWGSETLPPGVERELGLGWEILRTFGDALFERDHAPPAAATKTKTKTKTQTETEAVAQTVFLLVDSPFRRDQLQQKLTALSLLPETATGLSDLVTRLRALSGPIVVLCDNLEPNNNLVRLAEHLDDFPADRRPSLVLITGGSREPEREGLRARSLGGVGAWVEPFAPDHLLTLLSR